LIEAREIDFYTLSPIIKLKVRADQEHLVAPNSVTISQYHYEPAGWVRGLWDGDTPVGLIAMINPLIESPSFEEGDALDAAYLWRLMIADEHQDKGYGGEAIAIAYQQTRAWGLPKLQTSVVPGKNCPMPFYEKHGLVQTGKMLDKEIELMGVVPA
jgi:diamine N-acetyltransferase